MWRASDTSTAHADRRTRHSAGSTSMLEYIQHIRRQREDSLDADASAPTSFHCSAARPSPGASLSMSNAVDSATRLERKRIGKVSSASLFHRIWALTPFSRPRGLLILTSI